VARHRYGENVIEEAPGTEAKTPPEALTQEEIQRKEGELKDAKARDLAAKRAKRWDERPDLGRLIYEIMQAIKLAKEIKHG
jgi:flagellar motility protein MotE (MotC chaperone)